MGLSTTLSLGLSQSLSGEDRSVIEEVVATGQGAYTIHVGHPFLKYGDNIYGAPLETDGTRQVRIWQYNVATAVLDDAILENSTQDDDHNNGNIVIDPVNDLLCATHTDHNNASQPLQLFRGTSLDPNDITTASPVATLSMTNPSYSGSFLNPSDLDQVDIFTREGSFGASEWRLVRTENLGGSPPVLTEYDLFEDHYFDVRAESGETSGIWLICHGDPGAPGNIQETSQNQPQAIALWKLDRATLDLEDGDGNVEHNDITSGWTSKNGLGLNYLSYSDDLNTGTVPPTLQSVLVGTVSTTDPWGNTATCMTINAGGTTLKKWVKAATLTTVIGEYYAVHCLVKDNGTDKVMLRVDGGEVTAGVPFATFLLSGAGSVNSTSNIVNSFITAVGNGWYHIGITIQATAAVTGEIGLTPLNDAYSTSYTAAGESIVARSCQYEKSVDGTELKPYVQNRGDVINPTNEPKILAATSGVDGLRLMDLRDTGDYIEYVYCILDRKDGSDYASASGQGQIYYNRMDKATRTVGSPVLVGQSGDGLNSDGASIPSYIGAAIVGPFEFVYDRQNYNGNGKGQLVRAVSNDGISWATRVLKEDDDPLLRPIPIVEMVYNGGTLTFGLSRWVAYMKGPYTDWSAGKFDTEVELMRLA
jgi:hypothetical protein